MNELLRICTQHPRTLFDAFTIFTIGFGLGMVVDAVLHVIARGITFFLHVTRKA